MDGIYHGEGYQEIYDQMHALIPVLRPIDTSSDLEDLTYGGDIDLVDI